MTELHFALTERVHQQLHGLLMRNAPEEEVCFALVAHSTGTRRRTLILRDLIEPSDSERRVHGNVSFSAPFTNRAIDAAIDAQLGLALIHSHPGGRGFQRPSRDDLVAEQRTLEVAAAMLPGLPVVGAIVAGDGTVSGREYVFDRPGATGAIVANDVTRIVGPHLDVRRRGHVNQGSDPIHASHVGLFGAVGQALLSSLRVGIVGGGSVGWWVAIQLARLGIGVIGVIDYDRVERKNLNRLQAYEDDVGKRKVYALHREAMRSATAKGFRYEGHVASIVEDAGAALACDYDVLFSCADSHWSRQVLNSIGYAHLIPIIDGGTAITSLDGTFQSATARVQVAGPGRGCLACGRAYNPAFIGEEMAGLTLPHYAGDARALVGEPSVIALNCVTASYEVLRFMELVLAIAGQRELPRQRFDFQYGDTQIEPVACGEDCPVSGLEARGDLASLPTGTDPRFVAREPDQTDAIC